MANLGLRWLEKRGVAATGPRQLWPRFASSAKSGFVIASFDATTAESALLSAADPGLSAEFAALSGLPDGPSRGMV